MNPFLLRPIIRLTPSCGRRGLLSGTFLCPAAPLRNLSRCGRDPRVLRADPFRLGWTPFTIQFPPHRSNHHRVTFFGSKPTRFPFPPVVMLYHFPLPVVSADLYREKSVFLPNKNLPQNGSCFFFSFAPKKILPSTRPWRDVPFQSCSLASAPFFTCFSVLGFAGQFFPRQNWFLVPCDPLFFSARPNGQPLDLFDYAGGGFRSALLFLH